MTLAAICIPEMSYHGVITPKKCLSCFISTILTLQKPFPDVNIAWHQRHTSKRPTLCLILPYRSIFWSDCHKRNLCLRPLAFGCTWLKQQLVIRFVTHDIDYRPVARWRHNNKIPDTFDHLMAPPFLTLNSTFKSLLTIVCYSFSSFAHCSSCYFFTQVVWC